MKKDIKRGPTSLSLFTGAGGLDLGLEAAGFDLALSVEVDQHCRQTLSLNRPQWRQATIGDVTQVSPAELLLQAGIRKPRELDLLCGGPPCQPFSKSGYWADGDAKRLQDPRAATLDAYLNILEQALPAVFLIENVTGLAYAGKDEGLRLLRRRLNKINKLHGCDYQLSTHVINCAAYGVPQLRERIFLIGSREGFCFQTPPPTHVAKAEFANGNQELYRSAWDAIGDLDSLEWDEELASSGKWADLLPTIPEGLNYQWHTPEQDGAPLFGKRTRYWSFLLKLAKDRPSWTIQAEPGPATGPFHWRSRKLSVRELCRLQTFPDNYRIAGPYRVAQRQIGNAVPPAIGYLWGIYIRKYLLGHNVTYRQKLIPSARNDCPPPERPKSLPKKYWHLQGNHAPHPGTGLGPGQKSIIARRSANG